MADEAVGLVNVEEDGPAIETPQAPVAAPVAAVPAAPPEPPPDPDEEEAVVVGGVTMVPLPALKAVRGELKAAKASAAERDALAAENARLKGQVEGYQQVAQHLQQTRPPAQPSAPVVDDRALAFARGLDLYRPGANGQAEPDVEKAQAILGIVQQLARQEAGSLVQPIVQGTARDRSAQHYNWALNHKEQGRQVPKAVIDEMWAKMPVEYTAQPDIARTLWLTALGMTVANAQPQAAVPPPPVPTEGLGAPSRPAQRMTPLEERIAADRGIKPEKWIEHTKGFVPGRTTVLE